MRVLFAGGKDVGWGCLEYLIRESQSEVVGVFINRGSDTAKDRWYRSAAEIALAHHIPVFAPRSMNSARAIDVIRNLAPDIIVVVYYDQILKREVIDIPPHGCINLHMALAEEYRGCYPTTWALINGEKRTGVTLHYIDEGIDTGDIIAQKEVEITESDTGKSLYYKCTAAGVQLFSETFPLIEQGKAPRRKQKTTDKTRYYRRVFPSREIDFSKSGQEIYDYIRALTFPPFPPPYFYIGDTKMVIVPEELYETE